ncbi:MAG: DNA polymerase III subunit delta' [Rickettsiaceae bacterium]|nr:MAG: DNA polymerase III subunit delta' [Rickettsiaceae bacterium]
MRQLLEHYHNIGKLSNSWLIHTTNIQQTLDALKNFICFKLLNAEMIENHPDFKLITRLKEDDKNINIEQIKELKNFLFKTAAIAQYKVVIIYEADLMNNNAANACLKVLEDTPDNSYLFLLTKNPSHIIPTVRSRCSFLFDNSIDCKILNEEINDDLVQLLLNDNTAAYLEFISKISENKRKLWLDFSSTITNLLARLVKQSLGINVDLSNVEQQIIKQIKLKTTENFLAKYEQISQIIFNTNKFTLDTRAGVILIVELFRR